MFLIIPQILNELRFIKVADSFEVFFLFCEFLFFSLFVSLLLGNFGGCLRLLNTFLLGRGDCFSTLSYFLRFLFDENRCSINLLLTLLLLFLLLSSLSCSQSSGLCLLLLCLHQPRILFLSLLALEATEEVSAAALSLVITTPAVDLALASHSDRVMLAASDHHNVVVCTTDGSDQGRGCDVVFVTDTELAVVV